MGGLGKLGVSSAGGVLASFVEVVSAALVGSSEFSCADASDPSLATEPRAYEGNGASGAVSDAFPAFPVPSVRVEWSVLVDFFTTWAQADVIVFFGRSSRSLSCWHRPFEPFVSHAFSFPSRQFLLRSTVTLYSCRSVSRRRRLFSASSHLPRIHSCRWHPPSRLLPFPPRRLVVLPSIDAFLLGSHTTRLPATAFRHVFAPPSSSTLHDALGSLLSRAPASSPSPASDPCSSPPARTSSCFLCLSSW